MPDATIEQVCAEVSEGVVVAANYNNPGQLVISGSIEGVDAACAKLTAAGAKRAMRLKVGGAFHSPLMESARAELAEAIAVTPFSTPTCPIYQNVDALPHTNPDEIKQNLIAQLTAAVRWSYSVDNMIADGAVEFTEVGPGTALQGMVRKINSTVNVKGRQ